MSKVRSAAGFAAAAIFAFQPCLAAEDYRDSGFSEHRTAAFAGATLRVPLGARNAPRPSLRLQMTPSFYSRDAESGALRSRRPAGIEIGAPSGRPALYVAGQSASGLDRRLNLGGSTGTTLLIVGGVVVAVVLVLAAVAGAQPTAGPPEGAF